MQRRYPKPLRAWVVDGNGQLLEGTTVTFQLVQRLSGAGAAFLSGGTQASASTDASGIAVSPPLVANQTAGAFTATASDAGSSSPATFRLRNLPPRLLAARTAQTATVGRRYPLPLQVRVIDNRGRPVSGVTIGFQLGQGAGGAAAAGAGASFVTGGTQASATTNSRGLAVTPPLVANDTPGGFTATAGFAGSSSPVSFHLRNLPPRLLAARTAQTATVGRRYPLPLQVRVIDNRGRPVSGVTIGFQLGQGAGGAAAGGAGASFVTGGTQASATTNSRGLAVTPPLVANDTPGGFTATAGFAGSSSPVSFHLRNLSARLLASGRLRTSTVDSRYRPPLRARVVDDRGRPIRRITVTFQPLPRARAVPPSLSSAAETPGDGDHRHRRRSPPLPAPGCQPDRRHG